MKDSEVKHAFKIDSFAQTFFPTLRTTLAYEKVISPNKSRIFCHERQRNTERERANRRKCTNQLRGRNVKRC